MGYNVREFFFFILWVAWRVGEKWEWGKTLMGRVGGGRLKNSGGVRTDFFDISTIRISHKRAYGTVFDFYFLNFDKFA